MSNVINGVSTVNPVKVKGVSYNTESNSDLNTTNNNFSLNMNQYFSNLDNIGIRNVPLGRITQISNEIPNYNISIDDLNTNSNSSTIDIIDSINNLHSTNSSVDSEFRVKITAKDESVKRRIANAVRKASNTYGVDANLILAVMKQESNFNPNVTSKSGARGLMQIMPKNLSYLGVKDAYNIEDNINGGTKLLKEYLDKYNGNVEMALMAYNGGPTKMAKRGVKSINDLYKMPPETQDYVPKVMKIYRGY